ncbi:hypothetical protein LCGC14_1257880 [marine sediment metagenome]|uniref:Uncharacterized protein n=1 Tax=marine sediment metagenome TaxID=412755 RepID=A0A0F9L1G5_9ZZZZ|nr:hypothetical protein [Candidatus Aminicenantes bacterium]
MGIKTLEELKALKPIKYRPGGVPAMLATLKEKDDLICGDVDGEMWQPVLTDKGWMRRRW